MSDVEISVERWLALNADAVRYRWLREHYPKIIARECFNWLNDPKKQPDAMLDYLIDADIIDHQNEVNPRSELSLRARSLD